MALRCHGFDKYGRLLGELFDRVEAEDCKEVAPVTAVTRTSLNSLLVETGLARVYQGGKRLPF